MKIKILITLLSFSINFTAMSQSSNIFFSENFDSSFTPNTFLSQYYGNIASNPQWTIRNQISFSGNNSLQYEFLQGNNMQEFDHVTQHFGDATKSPVYPIGAGSSYQDIYIQFKLYYSPGFDWSAENNKQMIIGTDDSLRHPDVCCNPWVSHYITLKAGGDTNPSYFYTEANNKRNPATGNNWIDLAPNYNGFNQNNRYYISSGRWYTIEIHKRLNDFNQSNGIFEMWIDGLKISEYTNVLYRVPLDGTFGSNFNYGTNFIMLSTYINNPAPQNQYMYYDDIIISTAYIGLVNNLPPSTPQNLRVEN